MTETIHISLHLEPAQRKTYHFLPFQVPAGVECIGIRYLYDRRPEHIDTIETGSFTDQSEVNVIDLGLIDPQGRQIGASGSYKSNIMVSETSATPGYSPCPILPGEWQIIVGAYKVADSGVDVIYEVTFNLKVPRWLKGDLHTHTIASDGVHTLDELAIKAKTHGLDFIAVTDHNQFTSSEQLPKNLGITLIPGVEWTHFNGHANFIGVDKPYDNAYVTGAEDEAKLKFGTARTRGALITVNHPFDPSCSFLFDIHSLPCDCMEIWNGPMRESNLKAVGFWHELLCSGRKIPAVGGSDYHRDTPFIFLGGPTTCVFAESNGKSDILAALRAGHSFITFAPDGPLCELTAGDAIIGESVNFGEVNEVACKITGLLAGDVVRAVTNAKAEVLFSSPSEGFVEFSHKLESPGFARIEVLRAFLPGVPKLPALITNPIYFN
jgi:hypothetical protein